MHLYLCPSGHTFPRSEPRSQHLSSFPLLLLSPVLLVPPAGQVSRLLKLLVTLLFLPGLKTATMDAIKKKMQAMKVEKDNAMDRGDVCEQAAKDAKVW